MPGTLPTPRKLALVPRMLAAFKTRHEGYSELIVQRSPWVRDRDAIFRPVVAEVEGLCVTVDDCRQVSDWEMNYKQAQFFTLRVHDVCPGSGDHICSTDLNHVERIFKI